MTATTDVSLARVAHELGVRVEQVSEVVQLLDDGNTVPFITRYRRDQTGGLDEQQIESIRGRIAALRSLAQRKQTILRSIKSQGKLTDALRAAIEHADHVRRLEDLYLPFKPKKQTLATRAVEQGLEPLAREILDDAVSAADKSASDPLLARAEEFVNEDKKVDTAANALLGAGHILAEWFSEQAELRHAHASFFERTANSPAQKVRKTTNARAVSRLSRFP